MTITRPVPLVLALAFFTFIPVMNAAVSVVQIPLGALPQDSLRLAAEPVAFFLHSLAGVLFGVLGPLQFVLALRLRFGALHCLTRRVFVLAGAGLVLTGLALLLQVESMATELLDVARGVFGLALITTLWPTVVTLAIATTLSLFGAYAMAAGGYFASLPLPHEALVAITTVYAVRAVVPLLLYPLMASMQTRFIVVSSLIGGVYALAHSMVLAR